MLINDSANYISAYQSAHRASASVQTSNVKISGSYLDIVGGVNGAYALDEDGVDVSETARELLDRIKKLDVFSIIYPNSDARQKTKSLKEVEGDFLADFNDFSKAFGQLSGMMGISGADSFVMGLDGVGGMTVSGTSPGEAAKLQSGFNNNSTMVSRFAVMAAGAALVDAGNTVPGFKDAYSEDAVGAISGNIDALKERLLGFRAVSGGGSMQYGFMRDFELELSSTKVDYASAQVEAAAEA